MRTVFGTLGSLGFASTGLLLMIAYAEGKPPSLIATMMGGLACVIAGVAHWRGR